MQSENVNGVDLEKRSLLEANLSNEVAVISLDMLELFCTHFKVAYYIFFYLSPLALLFDFMYFCL